MFEERFLDSLAQKVADRVVEKMVLPTQTSTHRVLSIEQAANYLGRTEKAVRHLISKGIIPATKLDGKIQIDRKQLDQLIDGATYYEDVA